jgi:hypothetical protein
MLITCNHSKNCFSFRRDCTRFTAAGPKGGLFVPKRGPFCPNAATQTLYEYYFQLIRLLLKGGPVFSDKDEVHCQMDTADWTSSLEDDSVVARWLIPIRREQASG